MKKTSLCVGGAIAGLFNGFFGGGAGVVAVALFSAAQLSQKKAQATALLAVLPMTVASAAVYVFSGAADWSVCLWTLLGATAGGVVGALTLKRLSGNAVGLIFAAFTVFGAVKMLL